MKKLKEDYNNLKQKDVYVTLMFILYELGEVSTRFKTLRDLVYILDRDKLTDLCHRFGGEYIQIPTIDELQNAIRILLIYERINIKGEDEATVFGEFSPSEVKDYLQLQSKLEKFCI